MCFSVKIELMIAPSSALDHHFFLSLGLLWGVVANAIGGVSKGYYNVGFTHKMASRGTSSTILQSCGALYWKAPCSKLRRVF